jgi:hypothetical protein
MTFENGFYVIEKSIRMSQNSDNNYLTLDILHTRYQYNNFNKKKILCINVRRDPSNQFLLSRE